MAAELRRSALTYLIGVGLLTLYGGRVCPFLEGLGEGPLLVTLLPVFAGVLLLRNGLLALLRSHAPTPHYRDPWQTLLTDLGAWASGGVVVTALNTAIHDFPVGSGLKLLVGCLTYSVFAATFLALDTERDLILRLGRQGAVGTPQAGRFLSITTKFLAFLGSAVVFIVVVVILVLVKDAGKDVAFAPALAEIAFVFGCLLVGCLVIGRNYARNLRLTFQQQLAVFERVSDGRYDHYVPVISHDEFAVIARHTNAMIQGLAEREQLRSAFGKLLAPDAARGLEETGIHDLGGHQLDVTVLLVDIRGYGAISERLVPHDLIELLNGYFGLVVAAVHGHSGIVDKFMGDAAMAVFGLDGSDTSRDDAVAAALDMQDRLVEFNHDLEDRGLPRIECGIGIDHGPVIAGNIGPRERREYTVIGETVNTAARIQGLSGSLETPLAITEAVLRGVSPDIRERLEPLGSFATGNGGRFTPVHGLRAGAPVGADHG